MSTQPEARGALTPTEELAETAPWMEDMAEALEQIGLLANARVKQLLKVQAMRCRGRATIVRTALALSGKAGG